MSWFRTKRKSPESRLPRQLKTTREGKLLIMMTMGVGFAAINTGNNLLYLVLGMLLSMIIVSGVLSELTLRGLVVKRCYTQSIHAGTEGFLAVQITNTKKRLSSYSVEVEELLETGVKASQKPAYGLVIRPGETKTVAIRIKFEKRGLHVSYGLKIATRYPFSFFRKWRQVERPDEFVVYPAIRTVDAPWLESAIADGPLVRQIKVGFGGEYHGLREYVHGDDPRSIHWKTSARKQRLMSREYEAPGERRLWLLVWNSTSGEYSEAEAAAELGISEAASLAVQFERSGWAVGIKSLDGAIAPSKGPGHMKALMTHLALIPLHTHGSDVPLVVDDAVPAIRMLVHHSGQGAVGAVEKIDRVHEVSHVV